MACCTGACWLRLLCCDYSHLCVFAWPLAGVAGCKSVAHRRATSICTRSVSVVSEHAQMSSNPPLLPLRGALVSTEWSSIGTFTWMAQVLSTMTQRIPLAVTMSSKSISALRTTLWCSPSYTTTCRSQRCVRYPDTHGSTCWRRLVA